MLCALVGALAFRAGWFDPGADGSGGWIYEYQALIAGIIAAAAAGATVHVLRRQMAEDRIMFERQIALTTDPIRQDIERHCAVVLRPLERLIDATQGYMNFGRDEDAHQVLRFRAELKGAATESLAALQGRMGPSQIETATRFLEQLEVLFVEFRSGGVLPLLERDENRVLFVEATDLRAVLRDLQEAARRLPRLT